ncbi:hypothetical protein VTK56DRAFT_959 [Thermocarpiscus australiensis]
MLRFSRPGDAERPGCITFYLWTRCFPFAPGSASRTYRPTPSPECPTVIESFHPSRSVVVSLEPRRRGTWLDRIP